MPILATLASKAASNPQVVNLAFTLARVTTENVVGVLC